MAESTSQAPAKRADAERNRIKILEVARAAFAEAGAGVSMAEISRRAGVGMATLYRNFPNRHALLEALYTGEIDTMAAVPEPAEGESPGETFVAWAGRFFHFTSSKRKLVGELLRNTDLTDPVLDGRPRVVASGRPLLAAAQEAGEIRADLTLEQVLDLVLAISKIDGDAAYVEPILQATLDGLRAT